VLEVDGKQLAQLRTIIRYLSHEFKLYGKDKWEAAKLDEFMELQAEFNQEINYYYSAVFGCAGGAGTRVSYYRVKVLIPQFQEEMKQTKLIPALNKYLPLFEQILERAGSGFYTKNGPSVVDLWMAEIVDFMDRCDPEVIAEHPKILEQMKKVHALPELQVSNCLGHS
jgi:glutathione S-transferase